MTSPSRVHEKGNGTVSMEHSVLRPMAGKYRAVYLCINRITCPFTCFNNASSRSIGSGESDNASAPISFLLSCCLLPLCVCQSQHIAYIGHLGEGLETCKLRPNANRQPRLNRAAAKNEAQRPISRKRRRRMFHLCYGSFPCRAIDFPKKVQRCFLA